MKSKNELIKLLETKLKNNKINGTLAKALNEELLRKNINPNLTGLLFNGMKDIIDLNNNELILLSKVFYNYFKDNDLKPSNYFSDKDLINYETNIKEHYESISLVELNNTIKINDTSYVAFIGAEMLYNMYESNIIIYNKETQRSPKIRVLGKNYIVKQISLNKNAVKEIANEMLNETYESDLIIFNVLQLPNNVPNISYDNGTLYIKPNLNVEDEDFTCINVIDGMHRLSALVSAVAKLKKDKKEIPSSMGLIVKIIVRDIEGAKRVVTQSFKRSATDKDFLKSLEVNDYTKLADAFINNMPIVKEKIYPTYNEYIYNNGITYKTLITDCMRKILTQEKNFLFNLKVVTNMGSIGEKILSYILEEYYEKNISLCQNKSNIMRKNSFVYLLVFFHEIYKRKVPEEKFLAIANRIVSSSKTWDRDMLSRKKFNMNELIEEAKQILEEEILND
ncbi:hypothetical protein [Clostridium sp.]|uniref:hypothetical protein n=1 Tax=Clostridium sp. TaxID=1506 RepID=UPI0025BF7235|nr:hypothetical protein [Clostridium sp.]